MSSVARLIRLCIAVLPIAVLLIAAPHGAAAADCSDQKGKVIFDDTFSDDSGGWPTPTSPGLTTTFGKPDLTVKIVAPATYLELLNLTFNPKDADYCLELKVPAALADGSSTLAGLRILDSPDTGYNLGINSNGEIDFKKYLNNSWETIASNTDPSIKPGSLMTLRALVHNGLVSVSGNGQDIKRIRVPVPDAAVKFGFFFSTGQAVPAPGMGLEVVRLRVTAGE